jgi:hypothetical protein
MVTMRASEVILPPRTTPPVSAMTAMSVSPMKAGPR